MIKICKYCGKEYETKNKKQKCCSVECSLKSRFKDLTGQKFERLTVIKRVNNKKNGEVMWLCQCVCGNKKEVSSNNLLKGLVKSCGCMKKEQDKINLENSTHKLSKTRIYHIWAKIKHRCYNNHNNRYHCYGGRGITVCDEWKNDFMSFYNWSMQNGYNDTLTIDRIDVNGNYEPNNCRWATYVEQGTNTRSNHLITYNGETHCLSEWCRILNLNYARTINRLNVYNWSVEKAFTTPKKVNQYK